MGSPVERIFSSFSDSVAAASIAQVHKARSEKQRISSGEDIKTKGRKSISQDLAALLFLAKFIEFIIPSFRRLKPTEVINHFERLVREELDLRMEISAAAEFAENTKVIGIFMFLKSCGLFLVSELLQQSGWRAWPLEI